VAQISDADHVERPTRVARGLKASRKRVFALVARASAAAAPLKYSLRGGQPVAVRNPLR
jgi:hypothetical protein